MAVTNKTDQVLTGIRLVVESRQATIARLDPGETFRLQVPALTHAEIAPEFSGASGVPKTVFLSLQPCHYPRGMIYRSTELILGPQSWKGQRLMPAERLAISINPEEISESLRLSVHSL